MTTTYYNNGVQIMEYGGFKQQSSSQGVIITNTTNSNYINVGSETINATGTIINPKYLSAMVANSVNPTNLNLVNALSVASATTSPAYTINLQSAPAGVGSLWGIDYETTTGEDLQFRTSSATAGVSFNTVGNDNTTRIKNGRVAISGVSENFTIDYNGANCANTTSNTLINATQVKLTNAINNTNMVSNGFGTTSLTSDGTNRKASILMSADYDKGASIGLSWNQGTGLDTISTDLQPNYLLMKTTANLVRTTAKNDEFKIGLSNNTITNTITKDNIILHSSTNDITIIPSQVEITDTGNVLKKSTFGISQWIMRNGAFAYTQFDPTEINITNSNDTSRVSATVISTNNSTTGYSSSIGSGATLNLLSNVGTRINQAGINLGWNNGTSTSALTMSSTNITNTSPSLTKTWTSLLSIGTILQANVGSVSITSTRLCQCCLNDGAALSAGTYMVSYMVVIGASTTTYTVGIATPTAPIINNSTASGTLYQYGGTYVNNTGTTGAFNISGSSVIVFSGTTGCAIGLSLAPNQPISSAYLQAIRIS